MINAYAGRKRPRGWSFLAHHWELIIVSLESVAPYHTNGIAYNVKKHGTAFNDSPTLCVTSRVNE